VIVIANEQDTAVKNSDLLFTKIALFKHRRFKHWVSIYE